MRISAVLDRRLALLGLGREGSAMLAVLRAFGHHGEVKVFADRPPERLPPGCLYVPIANASHHLSTTDIVIRSPGFAPSHPWRHLIDGTACRQTTATQIFLHEARDASLPVVGITASKGKSTTSALTHASLLAAGRSSILVGNIGQPAIELLQQALLERPVVVMELSSYQCADLEEGYAPPLVSIGSLFPEHQDYHGGFGAYIDAKLNMVRMQRSGDALVCHVDSWPIVQKVVITQQVEIVNCETGLHFREGWFFDRANRLFDDKEMRILGRHNRVNACIAFALARRFGVTAEHFQNALCDFDGLPFRLQAEGVRGGISWINDSISTAPEATSAALEALGGGVHTLIAGGYERGYDPSPMVKAIVEYGVRIVVLLPDTGTAIAAKLKSLDDTPITHLTSTLEEAVKIASRATPRGTTCLFSPGAPSYNAFSGFEERGLEYRRCIDQLDA